MYTYGSQHTTRLPIYLETGGVISDSLVYTETYGVKHSEMMACASKHDHLYLVHVHPGACLRIGNASVHALWMHVVVSHATPPTSSNSASQETGLVYRRTVARMHTGGLGTRAHAMATI